MELFDLSADPSESEDLAEREPERTRLMLEELEAFSARLPARFDASPPGTDGADGAELEERLRALGYLE